FPGRRDHSVAVVNPHTHVLSYALLHRAVLRRCRRVSERRLRPDSQVAASSALSPFLHPNPEGADSSHPRFSGWLVQCSPVSIGASHGDPRLWRTGRDQAPRPSVSPYCHRSIASRSIALLPFVARALAIWARCSVAWWIAWARIVERARRGRAGSAW